MKHRAVVWFGGSTLYTTEPQHFRQAWDEANAWRVANFFNGNIRLELAR